LTTLDTVSRIANTSSLAFFLGLLGRSKSGGARSTVVRFLRCLCLCLYLCRCRFLPFVSIHDFTEQLTYLFLGARRGFLLVPLHLALRPGWCCRRLPCCSFVEVPHQREQGQPAWPLRGRARLHWWRWWWRHHCRGWWCWWRGGKRERKRERWWCCPPSC
jgi:hypothetical protein